MSHTYTLRRVHCPGFRSPRSCSMVSRSTRLEVTRNSRPQAMAATSATEKGEEASASRLPQHLQNLSQTDRQAAVLPADPSKHKTVDEALKNGVIHKADSPERAVTGTGREALATEGLGGGGQGTGSEHVCSLTAAQKRTPASRLPD